MFLIVILVRQLAAELNQRGMSVTERRLRDWWTEGLLPRPTPRGRGRAKGKVFAWHDLDIVDRATTVFQLKKRRERFENAHQLELFSLGYTVESQKLQKGLLSWLDYVEHCVLSGRLSDPDDVEDALSKLSTRASRPQSSRTGLCHRDLGALLQEFLVSVFAPFSECEQDVSELADTAGHWIKFNAAPHLILPDVAPAMLEDWLKWLQSNLSIDALRNMTSATGEAQFQKAQELWKCLRNILGPLVQTTEDQAAAAGLQTIGVQFSLAFGGAALLALICLLEHGYELYITNFANMAQEHLRGQKESSFSEGGCLSEI